MHSGESATKQTPEAKHLGDAGCVLLLGFFWLFCFFLVALAVLILEQCRHGFRGHSCGDCAWQLQLEPWE